MVIITVASPPPEHLQHERHVFINTATSITLSIISIIINRSILQHGSRTKATLTTAIDCIC